jgi:hypothetical protein
MKTNSWLRDSNEKINTRFSNILTLDSSVLTILFGLAYFLFQSTTKYVSTNTTWVGVSLGASMFVFLIAIAYGVFHSRPSDFYFADPSVLINKLKDMPHEKVLASMAATIGEQVSNNMTVVNDRGNKLNRTMILTAIGFVLVSITACLLIYSWLFPQSPSG